MDRQSRVPNRSGQLVWCPSDPSLGVGIVTDVEGSRVWVRFWRLEEKRAYTTRDKEQVLLRYVVGPGEEVQDNKGNALRVKAPAGARDGLLFYALEDGREALESELIPDIRDVGAKERLAALDLTHPETVRARLDGLRLQGEASSLGTRAVLGSRVSWLPHQIDVATRALASDPVRLLLADEVGLGKTVEAALIYAGLRQQDRADRVLVLTPRALTIQWLGELYRKAHELLVLLDKERIEDAEADFPGLSPFEAYPRMVASIDDLVADPKLAEMAGQASWDLVIIDEAHHLRWAPDGGGNPAYQLAEALAARSRHMLLLTATPMALDPTEYHALLRLLDPARFDAPEAFARVQQRVAGLRDLARGLVKAVEAEEPLATELLDTAHNVFADDADDAEQFDKWLKLDPQSIARKQKAQAVLDLLRERHGLAQVVVRNRRGPVGGMPARKPTVFALVPPEPQADLIDAGEGVMFDLAEWVDNPTRQRQVLGELLRALWASPRALVDIMRDYSPKLAEEMEAPVAAVVSAGVDSSGLPVGDSRLRWLVHRIQNLEAGDKVLVFVESAVSVQALKDVLDPFLTTPSACFHRDLAPRDQDRQVAWFRDPNGPAVMLCTEAGGEGRNFQFCNKVVLYDLPWRPATIEQRIGRVDRVGQKNDVHVWVPYFDNGFEAAVLKVMQNAIGVLDRTVGGIDHALEYVNDAIAGLVAEGAGVDEWKSLFLKTQELVKQAEARIASGVDPILDHASFSAERAEAVIQSVPDDLEDRLENFMRRFADHTRVQLKSKEDDLYSIEGAVGAAGRDTGESGFVGTFRRAKALDFENIEFLSYGHPLVRQAFEWASESYELSAALALCRGFSTDGAVFVWCFRIELAGDVAAAAAYFDSPEVTFAVDESGKPAPQYDDLLHRPNLEMDAMDPKPLRANRERWARIVEGNFSAADKLAQKAAQEAVIAAQQRLDEAMAERMRRNQRALARAQMAVQEAEQAAGIPTKALAQACERLETKLADLKAEHLRLGEAIEKAQPRALAVVAVRLVRTKRVSG